VTSVLCLIQVQSPDGEFVARLAMKVLCLQSASISHLRLQSLSMPSAGNVLANSIFHYSGFPRTWKTWKTPGKILKFCVRPGIFGMISRFTLDLTL